MKELSFRRTKSIHLLVFINYYKYLNNYKVYSLYKHLLYLIVLFTLSVLF